MADDKSPAVIESASFDSQDANGSPSRGVPKSGRFWKAVRVSKFISNDLFFGSAERTFQQS